MFVRCARFKVGDMGELKWDTCSMVERDEAENYKGAVLNIKKETGSLREINTNLKF